MASSRLFQLRREALTRRSGSPFALLLLSLAQGCQAALALCADDTVTPARPQS
ncbi:MAG: hypothetical protein ACRDTC_05040 [Pseudonocardiaceae bacterium]